MARKQSLRTRKASDKRGTNPASLSVGRPTKLTPETTKKISDAILAGATYAAASQYAGIAYSTFNDWMAQGRAATEPNAFSEFSEAIETANASAQVFFALNIKTSAMGGDWRAAAWMLERRFPKDYGQRIGAIDEKSLDDAIESELARMVGERQAQIVGTSARDAVGEPEFGTRNHT